MGALRGNVHHKRNLGYSIVTGEQPEWPAASHNQPRDGLLSAQVTCTVKSCRSMSSRQW